MKINIVYLNFKKKIIFYFRCKICGNILRIKIYDDHGLCISCKCGIKIKTYDLYLENNKLFL